MRVKRWGTVLDIVRGAPDVWRSIFYNRIVAKDYTLVRRDLYNPGGVPLQLRGTSQYPALSVDVVHEEV